MKLIFSFCLSLITLSVFSQTQPPIAQNSKLYEFKNGLRIDSAFFAPRRDTFTTDATMKAPGMLLYNLSDSIMYYRNSFAWKPLLSGSLNASSLQDVTTVGDTTSNVISFTDFVNYQDVTGLTIGRGIIYSGRIFAGTFEDLGMQENNYSNFVHGQAQYASIGLTTLSSGGDMTIQGPNLIFSQTGTPTVSTFNSRVSGNAAINSSDFVTLQQFNDSIAGNTLYTGDGVLSSDRIVDGNTHSILFNNISSFEKNMSNGSDAGDYSYQPNSFNFVWNPSGEPTSQIGYSSNAFGVSLATSGQYNVTTSENAQVGLGYQIYEKASGGITTNERIELQQGFTSDSSVWAIRHYKTNVNQPELLIAIDSFGTMKLKKYPNNIAQDSVLSTDAFGKVKMKYVGVAGAVWDSTKIKDSVILNRLFPLQAANYYINGSGSDRRHTVFNTDTASYVPYYVLGHAGGADTTKQSWTIGLRGVGGGGPTYAGNVLTWRSYTTAGAFLGDRMELTRGGSLTAVNLTAGFTGFTGVIGSNVIRAVGDIGTTGDVNVNGAINQRGALVQSGTTTVTGNYTVLSTNLFINVNNTANCTITIPAANINPGLDGRVLHIKKTINNAFTVTIVVSGGTQTIDGASNYILSDFNASVTLHDDGAAYFSYPGSLALSGSYIQNQTASPQTAGFNITGDGTVGGILTAGTVYAQNALIVDAGTQQKVNTVTTNTTLTSAYSTLLVNNSGSVTLSLPDAGTNNGRIYRIKKISAALNDVVIDGNASETIDGNLTVTLTLQWSSIDVQSNGSGWFIVASYVAATTL